MKEVVTHVSGPCVLDCILRNDNASRNGKFTSAIATILRETTACCFNPLGKRMFDLFPFIHSSLTKEGGRHINTITPGVLLFLLVFFLFFFLVVCAHNAGTLQK